MEEIAHAKLNLALHVRAREPDGYHRIETIFAFAEDGDRLSVAAGEGLSLRVTGPFARALGAEEDNLVLRAARALRERTRAAAGAALLLEKRLPVASGLGGGSADAAAALRLLGRWWNAAMDEAMLLEIAGELGADVPACVVSRTCRGYGRGDRLSDAGATGFERMPVLIVNPLVPVSTAEVFRRWDGVDRGELASAADGRNDLEAPALQIAPEIGEVLAALGGTGPVLSRMSGSGASCFAIFGEEKERDAAASTIAASHPHWWRLSTRLR